MGEVDSLDVVSIRLVKDASIMSDHRLASAEDVATLMGDVLRELDREVVCVINLRADGTPINCNFASMGTVSSSLACPFVFMDCIHYKVREDGCILSRAAYIVLGIIADGYKDILSITVGANETSKFWLGMLNDLKNRGVQDVPLRCGNGHSPDRQNRWQDTGRAFPRQFAKTGACRSGPFRFYLP